MLKDWGLGPQGFGDSVLSTPRSTSHGLETARAAVFPCQLLPPPQHEQAAAFGAFRVWVEGSGGCSMQVNI